MINISETCEFDPIEQVVTLPPRPAEYQEIALSVSRYTRLLRRYLATLGRSEREMPRSWRGNRLDVGCLPRLALTGDPAVLIGQEETLEPDLFLGVAIDTSGSMSFADRMEKAISFAVLILESVRRQPGVSSRALAFTDSIVFDLGGPGNTSVAGLEPQGGNNDAAGLLHLARQAMASSRSRKLLVMISDGCPTECSFSSLRHLVELLGATYGIGCVQVAVHPLEDEFLAFPDYTDLSDLSVSEAVSSFGRLLQRVIHRQFGL